MSTATPPNVTDHGTALTPYQERGIALRENMTSDHQPRAIVPRSFADAQAFANTLATSELVPYKLRQRAPDVLMIILAGAELEIPPVRSLALFHVIEGVPKLSADGIAARCSASDRCEYLEPREQGLDRVVWAAKKTGRPEVTLAWAIGDAMRAGLLGRKNKDGSPGNWEKYPRQMLNARCKADLCRMVWPEICAGLVSAEEAYDGAIDAEFVETKGGIPATVTPIAPPAAAKSPSKTKRGPDLAIAPPPVDPTAHDKIPETPAEVAAWTAKSTDDAFAKARAAVAERDAARAADVSTAKDETANFSPAAGKSEASATPAASDTSPTIPATGSAESAVKIHEHEPPPADDAGGFGEDAPAADAAPKKTIALFEKLLAACKTVAEVDEYKRADGEWVLWSKNEGKPYAPRMRGAFANRKAELEARK